MNLVDFRPTNANHSKNVNIWPSKRIAQVKRKTYESHQKQQKEINQGSQYTTLKRNMIAYNPTAQIYLTWKNLDSTMIPAQKSCRK